MEGNTGKGKPRGGLVQLGWDDSLEMETLETKLGWTSSFQAEGTT